MDTDRKLETQTRLLNNDKQETNDQKAKKPKQNNGIPE